MRQNARLQWNDLLVPLKSPKIPPKAATESLNWAVNTKEQWSNLEASVEHEKSKILTLDTESWCDRCGCIETDTEGRRTLLSNIGAKGACQREDKSCGRRVDMKWSRCNAFPWVDLWWVRTHAVPVHSNVPVLMGMGPGQHHDTQGFTCTVL